MSEEAELASDIQLFPCGLCPVKKVKKSELMRHIIKDHDIFPCDECTYYFETKESLESHLFVDHKKTLNLDYERSKSEGGRFKCKYCEFTGKHRINVKQHENGKHSEKPIMYNKNRNRHYRHAN